MVMTAEEIKDLELQAAYTAAHTPPAVPPVGVSRPIPQPAPGDTGFANAYLASLSPQMPVQLPGAIPPGAGQIDWIKPTPQIIREAPPAAAAAAAGAVPPGGIPGLPPGGWAPPGAGGIVGPTAA